MLWKNYNNVTIPPKKKLEIVNEILHLLFLARQHDDPPYMAMPMASNCSFS